MENVGSVQSQPNPDVTHSEAVPPDVLTAKLEALRGSLKDEMAQVFRIQVQLLLEEYTGLKPLMSVSR